jgi:predicted transposase YbfD/YdcC
MDASIGRSLLSFLAEIPDPRSRHGRQHSLSAILGLTCCAIMCGAKSYAAIGQWAHDQDIAFMHRLGFTRMPPKMGGIRKVLMALDATAFENALTQWATALLNEPVSSKPTSLDAFALDGKTARGSFDGLEKAVHLLSLLAHKSGLTYAQTPVPNGGDDKTNEHKTALRLLEGLVLKGRVITGDAMFCQRDLSKQVIDQQGHFLWFVKENQPTLLHDIETAFASSVEGDFSPSAATNLGGGHGYRDNPRQGARSPGTSNVKGDDGVERVSGLARRRPSGTSRAGRKGKR